MNKLNFNDWQTIYSRKEIEDLRKEQKKGRKFDIILYCELFLAIIGFIFDSFLSGEAEVLDASNNNILYKINTNNKSLFVWMSVLILGVIILIILIAIPDHIQTKKNNLRQKLKNEKDIVDIFDNKINFYIMSAESIDLSGINLESKRYVDWYYYIEKSYYTNKCTLLLQSVKSTLKNAIQEDDQIDGVVGCKISKARFFNIIKLIESQYFLLSNIEAEYNMNITDAKDEETILMEKVFSENAAYYNILCSVVEDNKCFFDRLQFPEILSAEKPYSPKENPKES